MQERDKTELCHSLGDRRRRQTGCDRDDSIKSTTLLATQVWAGNEACEPVTWQECKLVPKNVKFIVPEINCTDGNELWYHEPEVVEDVRMTNTFTCEASTWILDNI